MKKYLITGGCGFFGANLAARLLEMGQSVVLFDNLCRQGAEENLAWLRGLGRPEVRTGDVRHPHVVAELVQETRPDVVFHLAGQVAMTTSVKSPMDDFMTNAAGTVHLLEALRLHRPEASLVYSSTNKVYGAMEGVRLVEETRRYSSPSHPCGIGEDQPLDFRTPYGCSKGAADQYVLEYARTFNLRTAVFRHSTIYGCHQHATFDQGWVGWFCRQALVQKEDPTASPFTISGDGKQVRDLLFAADAVDCYLAAEQRIDTIRGRAFNLGGGMGNSSSLLELFDWLEGELGFRLRYEKLPWRHEDQRFFVADLDAVFAGLSWSPKVGKKEGVRQVLSWASRATGKG
jgi:CDP-paratose 2-epimerase